MIVFSTIVTLCALAALLIAEHGDRRTAKWVAKPVASLGFVAAAIAAGAAESALGQALLVALGLSLLGDVFLLSHARAAFLGGLGAFLLGHVAFAASFVLAGVDPLWTAVALVPLVAIAVVVGRWLLPHVERGMRPPVLAYIAVITVMVALAAGCVARGGATLLLVAAVMFFVSDLSVARDRFVAPGFANRLWGLPLYYLAQLLFAWSLVR